VLRSAKQSVGDSTDEPIIQLVDSLLAEAVRMRASDVHVEPGAADTRVRYRIDGVLREVNRPPRALHGPIVSRVKIMAGLNIAEKRLPQDGRLQLVVEGRSMDVRLSTLPATHGESVVMRLLDRSQPIRGLAELGLLPDGQRQWEELIHRPHGMVLVTGPTGAGKTTTLYSALSMLNQPDRKLITVEDPVEYQLSGVNQVLVKTVVGLTFASGLRAMLRQAPDVIMVGEIRDQETAQIAVQAALTGHLVLSTLHTNDAPSAMTRLMDMGIPPFLVASTVQGVLAQRLGRRVCPACRITDDATVEERAFLERSARDAGHSEGIEALQVIRSNGCDKCHGSGFFGRIGLFELLVVSDAIRALLVKRPSASAIRTLARQEGMRGLREDGIVKIREGLTTVAEVLRLIVDVTD
jgi:type II secretory ATPase GspE/PulE/Tfp pilus assembly ATPase PilB-like protein